jgi:hypothetical protein
VELAKLRGDTFTGIEDEVFALAAEVEVQFSFECGKSFGEIEVIVHRRAGAVRRKIDLIGVSSSLMSMVRDSPV